MKLSSKIYILVPLLSFLFLCTSQISANAYDFVITSTTNVKYTTGEDKVDVETLFLREVKNKGYKFTTSGEQSFHIPDLIRKSTEEIKSERDYKKSTISVINDSGTAVPFSIQELEYGDGMYIKVPNYRQTTYTLPYRVTVKYSTHDYVRHVFNWVLIEYPALHEDTKFEQTNAETNTTVQMNYNLNIVVDKNISPLTKIYPDIYNVKEDIDKTTYSFPSDQRLGKSSYLEFGTNQVYKFELSLTTQKTDNIIPERYSSAINALSTNIYELSLPRDFAENNQTVKIESISPLPTKLFTTTEGNIIGTFEVPANKESEILVTGYLWLTLSPLSEGSKIPNITYEKYLEDISKDSDLNKYLSATRYWESNDSFIQSKAKELTSEKILLMDVIKADYSYISDTLEYDLSKSANPNAERIGAKAALQGGASVCMEYSDSMVALLRAQGIPSRAAFGYTSLDQGTEEKISHQWVQVWIPDYGWLSIDPSYESQNMMIGQSMQYILWNTLHDDNFIDIKAYSADNFEFDTSKYKVKVYAVDEKALPDNLLSYSDIQPKNEESTTTETLNLIIKTTPIGKAVIIVMPILTVLFLLITLFSLTSLLSKRLKSRKASANQ